MNYDEAPDAIDNFRDLVDEVFRARGVHVIDICTDNDSTNRFGFCEGVTDIYIDHAAAKITVTNAVAAKAQTVEAIESLLAGMFAGLGIPAVH